MIATGAFRNAALVNLSSEDIATGWREPVALCFIDGDHSYKGVRRDWDCWRGHIAPGGMVAFDDARNPEIGPAKVLA